MPFQGTATAIPGCGAPGHAYIGPAVTCRPLSGLSPLSIWFFIARPSCQLQSCIGQYRTHASNGRTACIAKRSTSPGVYVCLFAQRSARKPSRIRAIDSIGQGFKMRQKPACSMHIRMTLSSTMFVSEFNKDTLSVYHAFRRAASATNLSLQHLFIWKQSTGVRLTYTPGPPSR